MSFAFDLWSADDVRGHATGILKRLQDGSMPCDGAWPADKIEVFQRCVRPRGAGAASTAPTGPQSGVGPGGAA